MLLFCDCLVIYSCLKSVTTRPQVERTCLIITTRENITGNDVITQLEPANDLPDHIHVAARTQVLMTCLFVARHYKNIPADQLPDHIL